ncbi:MAG: AzlC family ABC transporter permease, partial [Gammaproteobacteria bacterium]|nr:AzlC family ABC transporter permease [Gammaproteobacteria bacterium]
SAAAQLSVVALVAGGSPALVPLLTTVLLNVHMLLFGLAAARAARPRRGMRMLTAFFLTDGAFAVALGVGRLALPALLGAGVSMYLGWNIGTALGLLLGDTISNPRRAGVDLVAPLMFLAVLAPLLRGWPELLCALLAAGTTLCVLQWLPGGLAVLAGCLAGSLTGAALPVRGAR